MKEHVLDLRDTSTDSLSSADVLDIFDKVEDEEPSPIEQDEADMVSEPPLLPGAIATQYSTCVCVIFLVFVAFVTVVVKVVM